jgi:mannose-6-phosphate isomerase-like protein (cupin superfamily)
MRMQRFAQLFDLEKVEEQLGEKAWSPLEVARVGDFVLRAALFEGEYHWHVHEEDELFLVHRGQITIDTEAGALEIQEGQGAVIPAGMRHRPRAEKPAFVLMVEPFDLSSRGVAE